MFIRGLFVAQRFFAYTAVFLYLLFHHLNQPWWQWLIGVFAVVVGTLEIWKRPDERAPVMRLGIWTEIFAVSLWTLSVQNSLVLILLISPLARSGVHLGWHDSLFLAVWTTLSVFVGGQILSAKTWLTGVELAATLGTAGYSLIVGELLRERDGLKRAVQVTAFDREQRIKDNERLRMAGQLHDTLGQHWAAVIRALDVVEQVSGEQQRSFIGRARSAAMDGLSAMRYATHTWNAGRQSSREWLQYAEESLRRLQETVGLDIQFDCLQIDWSRFDNRTHVAEVLARTLIEGATNAIRHGAARRLTITVQSDAEGIKAVIQDNGSGLKKRRNESEGGLGLTVLQSMAAETGGSLRLHFTHDYGTTLILQVPYTG